MQVSADKVWGAAQAQLKGMLSADTFNLWFAPLRATGVESNTIVLEVADDFCEVWLKENYMGLLQDVLAVASGRRLDIKFKVSNLAPSAARAHAISPTAKSKAQPEPAPADKHGTNGDIAFNPKNTFDSFVVGNNNNFAYAATLAVAQSPGKAYNPLFLYGGVGLGKTHLLHAVGQHVTAAKKGAKVTYLSSEKFTNEYIDALQPAGPLASGWPMVPLTAYVPPVLFSPPPPAMANLLME